MKVLALVYSKWCGTEFQDWPCVEWVQVVKSVWQDGMSGQMLLDSCKWCNFIV